MSWTPYATLPGSTVTGTLLQWEGVGDVNHAPRTILAWLPPSYESQPNKRYPVIYLHDGQNVFDAATSYNLSEWGADETLTDLAAQGLEAIAVAIPNANERRYHEYSPVRHPGFPPEVEGGGGGDDYLAFLINTVKPLADHHLRTLPDAAHTTLLGSSMGGLISLHALLTRPDVFGGAGVMSPAFWACAGEAFGRVTNSAPITGKIWLDIGGQEGTDHPEQQQAYWDDAHAMRDLLLTQGIGQRLRFLADPEGIHRETAWKARLPEALRFLLGGGWAGQRPEQQADWADRGVSGVCGTGTATRSGGDPPSPGTFRPSAERTGTPRGVSSWVDNCQRAIQSRMIPVCVGNLSTHPWPFCACRSGLERLSALPGSTLQPAPSVLPRLL